MTQPSPGYSFPIARKVLAFAGRARANWLLRHQNAANFWIHMVGIPLSLLVAPILLGFVSWQSALAAFFLGYFLQWVGHRIEGNDVGELIPIKRMLGLRVVAIAPQFETPHSPVAS